MASNSAEPGSIESLRGLSREEIFHIINVLRTSKDSLVEDPAEQSAWELEEVNAPPLWKRTEPYKENQFCMSCYMTVTMFQDYLKRGTEDFKWRHMREVNNLMHINSAKLLSGYTPKDILNEAINGCHLCSLAIGSSWNRGNLPFHTVKWARNPKWRRKAQYFLWNAYREDLNPLRDTVPQTLCQLVFGTNMDTDLDADQEGFWSAINLFTEKELTRVYSHPGRGYILQSQVGDPPAPPLCASTGDDEALHLAAWWLKRCLTEHERCRSASSKSATEGPARLLYVGDTPDSHHLSLHICDKDEKNTAPEYLCLSYCWGKKQFPRLTTANLSDMVRSVDFKSLPATISDAILITRKMGYQYLWIDALCIIQDSKADWASESVKMGSIYRNSILTIAALGAVDSFTGCFMNRNPLCFRDISVHHTDFKLTNSIRTPVGQWELQSTGEDYPREYEVVGAAASPLQTRAWVVQEQLASPRTLYFGLSGIYWQCIECEAHESCPLGRKMWPTNLKALFHLAPQSTDDYFTREIWRRIVDRYTSCKLTFQSDKLVAISGIARLLEHASGKTYSAGLWEQHLSQCLTWHSRSPSWSGNHLLGRIESDTPSFSWASVVQPVTHYEYDGLDHQLDALSVTMNPVDHSPTDNPKKYSLHVRSQLKPVLLLPRSQSRDGMPRLILADTSTTPSGYKWEDTTLVSNPRGSNQELLRFDWTFDRDSEEGKEEEEHSGPFSYVWMPDIVLDGTVTRAWYMCLVRYSKNEGTAGLVVVPSASDQAKWERIGFLGYHGFPKNDKEGIVRRTVQNQYNEVDWEETAKCRAPNPFLVDTSKEFVDIVLV